MGVCHLQIVAIIFKERIYLYFLIPLITKGKFSCNNSSFALAVANCKFPQITEYKIWCIIILFIYWGRGILIAKIVMCLSLPVSTFLKGAMCN